MIFQKPFEEMTYAELSRAAITLESLYRDTNDPRYRALPLPSAPAIDAALAFVVAGWPVVDPLTRYRLAQRLGKTDLVASHDARFLQDIAVDRVVEIGAADAQPDGGREGEGLGQT